MVDALFIDRKNKVLLPKTEVLQELYKELFVAGHNSALRKLHNFLGYYRGHEGQNSPELVTLLANEKYNEIDSRKEFHINLTNGKKLGTPLYNDLTEEDLNKALDLISKGHYIYNFSKLNYDDHNMLIKFMFLQTLDHPNYNANSVEFYNRTPLSLAMYYLNFPAVTRLLQFPEIDIKNQAPEVLHKAAFHGHTAVVRELLSRGADVNAKYNNRTLLDSAALYSGRVDPEMKQLIQEYIQKSNNTLLSRIYATMTSFLTSSISNTSASTAIPPAAPAAQVDTSAVKSQRTRGSDSQEPNTSKRRR